MKHLSLSVIVTTYNRPDSLQAVLRAFNAQTQVDFEVLVADDGSTEHTRLMVESFPAHFALHHVWQPDEGFQAARIRNLGIAKAKGDYLVFVDGDCVPRTHFIARHRELAEAGCFVSGNRILANPELTQHILDARVPVWEWSARQWLSAYLHGKINRLTPLLGLPGGGWRKRAGLQHWRGAKTCNLGVWRRALTAVNGFDEAFQGWGHEDADLVARLLQSGQCRKDGRFAVPVLHLWHPDAPRGQEQENLRRLAATLEQCANSVAKQKPVI